MTSFQKLHVNIRENHHASGDEYRDALEGEEREHVQGTFAEEHPEGKKGDGEEVPEEHERFLDDACEETNGAFGDSKLEVAEAAALENFEVRVCMWLALFSSGIYEEKRGQTYFQQQIDCKEPWKEC